MDNKEYKRFLTEELYQIQKNKILEVKEKQSKNISE